MDKVTTALISVFVSIFHGEYTNIGLAVVHCADTVGDGQAECQ